MPSNYPADWMTKDASAEKRAGKKVDAKLSLEKLTEPTLVGARGRTEKGQAHWGGEGPSAKRCRHCVHWTPPEGIHMYSVKGVLAKGWCQEYVKLSNTKAPGPKFRHGALTCKHFIENPKPPREFAKLDASTGGWV